MSRLLHHVLELDSSTWWSCFRIQKVIKDMNKYANSQDKGPWPQSRVSALERALGELLRVLEKKVPSPHVLCRPV